MNQITITVDKHVGIIFKSPFGVCTLSHDVEFRDVPCSPENPEGYEEEPYALISGIASRRYRLCKEGVSAPSFEAFGCP